MPLVAHEYDPMAQLEVYIPKMAITMFSSLTSSVGILKASFVSNAEKQSGRV